MENGLLSDGKQRKPSVVALRWILLMNFCKLTVANNSNSNNNSNNNDNNNFIYIVLI